MTALLATLTEIWSEVLSWVGTLGTTIMGTPFLVLMVIALPVLGFGVGILKRLIRL